ncbi:MAG: hypothetical protein GXO21_04690 [Aquificae bacterium]|nr:hypothetical protein [Aquificota bacterium]
MKKILLLILFLISASSCANKQESRVVYRYIEKPVYIECQKPAIPEKPKAKDYQVLRIKFEEKYYYCVDVENAKILSENWLKYRNWCESINTILKNIK